MIISIRMCDLALYKLNLNNCRCIMSVCFVCFYLIQDPETESTEEEVEPKLKYVRISNDLQNILSKDAVSNNCCVIIKCTSQYSYIVLYD